MTFVFEVLVTLKPGLSDPQGKAVEGALPDARLDQRPGRARRQAHPAAVEAADEAAARAQVDEMATASAVEPRDRGLPDPGDRGGLSVRP